MYHYIQIQLCEILHFVLLPLYMFFDFMVNLEWVEYGDDMIQRRKKIEISYSKFTIIASLNKRGQFQKYSLALIQIDKYLEFGMIVTFKKIFLRCLG